jgi:hypothetical protein
MVKYMKKRLLTILSILFILSLGSCNDPIFSIISQEVKPLPPLISGSPTNFVEFDGRLYVASGSTLYRYDGTDSSNVSRGEWQPIQLGRHINQLAVTGSTFYALCGESNGMILKRSSNGTSWSDVPNPTLHKLYSIYAAGSQLFIGAGEILSEEKSLYILNESFVEITSTGNSILTGAASNGSNIYLTAKDLNTTGGGFILNLNTSGRTSGSFVGIISLGSSNTVIAITREGNLRRVSDNASIANFGSKQLSLGALAIWENKQNTSEKLLLVGRNDEMENSVNYEHGYLELDLNSDGTIKGGGLREPGTGYPSSIVVGDNNRYKSTIGQLVVNHLAQAPDGILFASTHNKGVYSYRIRDGEWQWNAEQ